MAEGAALYTRASRNIHDQQVTVGRRLATERGRDAIVLVGDAGAIPYVSGLHAVDALGLGGYHGVPFVRAAVLGEAATLELIGAAPAGVEADVPSALYPNWFPGIAGTFGHETGRVSNHRQRDLRGGDQGSVPDADWSAMRTDGDAPDESLDGPVLDELDAADVVSEERHGYVSPAPHGGWTLFDVRIAGSGARRFDAGRIVPGGVEESFELVAPAPAGSTLVVRTDESPAEVEVTATAREPGVREAFVVPLQRGNPAEGPLVPRPRALPFGARSRQSHPSPRQAGSAARLPRLGRGGKAVMRLPTFQPRTRARARGRFGCAPRWVIEPFLSSTMLPSRHGGGQVAHCCGHGHGDA